MTHSTDNPWFEKKQYIKRQNRGPILQTQQKIRNIFEETETEEQTETDETIDPKSTCYIREMMEDLQNINFITSMNFTNEKVADVNKTKRGEFWIKTKTNNQQIFWLADTGSPRSFMNIDTAQNLLANGKTAIKQRNKTIGEFRFFNNNKIDIIGTIQVYITSGSSNAKNCTILLVNNNTINIMGRDIMDQLGLRLTMTTKNKGEKNLFNISNTHQRISKWIFSKYPHLCTRLGRSNNHVAKSTFKKSSNPHNTKDEEFPYI